VLSDIESGGDRRLPSLFRAPSPESAWRWRGSVAALVGVVLLLAAGLSLYGRSVAIPGYLTTPVERGTIATVVKATGRVEATHTVEVSSQLSGAVAQVFVDFNDRVKAGEPIAALDPGIYQAHVNETAAAVKVAEAKVRRQRATAERARLAVERAATDRQLAEDQVFGAQAKASEAEREMQRKLQLARSGNAPDRDLSQARAARDSAAAELRAAQDQVALKAQMAGISAVEVHIAEADLANAEAAVEQQQAVLDQARVDLERSVLRAPIDGVVIKRDVNPGQTVAVALEAKTLFTIADDLARMEVHGTIDEADIGKLRVGQSVTFNVDAYPEREFEGSVLQVRRAPETTHDVVTYTAVISAANPDLLLYPGMTATLRITVNRSDEVLKVPNQALHFRPPGAVASNGATVWTLGPDGRPAPATVAVGLADDRSSEIRSGALTAGQSVVIGIAEPPAERAPFGIHLGL
jgi:HlyD family secretion protein